MKSRLIDALTALLVLTVCCPSARAADLAPSALQVPRWQPQDFTFRTEARPDQPFAVQFRVEATGPGGVKLSLPGFYDGNGTWKARLAPTVEGAWSIRTQSTLAGLNGQAVSFACVANPSPTNHGPLRVDPKCPRHFVFEDGTRYFLLGYECDWLWALDMKAPDLKTVNRFLDKLAASGFNYVILNAYAHDTSWRKGKTGEDDFGPPPMFAWEGSNEKPEHGRFNLAYWQHYDRIIDALYRRGMIAHVMIKVYNKMVQWPAKNSAQEDLYFRWLIARYAAYPNVHWDFSKEANNEPDLDYKLGRIQFLRQNDPYRRLVTVHDDHATYDRGAYDRVLDYRCDQQHSKWHATLLEHRRQRTWPVVNVEYGYEHGPQGLGDKTYGVVQSPQEVCRRAWEVCMAGSYPVYYYTHTAWDVIRPDDTPPGYAYCKHLRDFFQNTEYWRMEPADGLVSEGHCLAEAGRQYVVFLNASRPFSLRLDGLGSPRKAEWFHPFTGERRDAGTLTSGTLRLTPPKEFGPGPVALRVGP
jgi:hypothetical protein